MHLWHTRAGTLTQPPLRLSITVMAAIMAVLSQSGCGILLGNVKPVEEKSESYGVMDLSRENPEWVRIESEREAAEGGPKADSADGTRSTEVSDVAYQSNKTASIISLNSGCRLLHEASPQDLGSFTNLLFLGISDITLREEKELTVQSTPALQTTLQGKLGDERMQLRTVVLRRGPCVYDLMYVARPEHFRRNEQDFARFVDSLRLK